MTSTGIAPAPAIFTGVPSGAPLVVVLIEQEGCPACDEYHPIFVKAAASYAHRGLPFVRVDANSTDPTDQQFMASHNVEATPTVIVATKYRVALARLEGVATDWETRQLLDIAWAHNRPMGW